VLAASGLETGEVDTAVSGAGGHGAAAGDGADEVGVTAGAKGTFSFGLTSRCQQRCLHCVEQELRGRVSDRTLEEIRAEVAQRAGRYRAVALVNGESTLHPQFLDALRIFRDAGLQVFLTTNGAAFADAGVLLQAIEAGLCGVDLTVHSRDAALEDRICGVPGAHAAKVAALRSLAQQAHSGRLALKVSVTVTARNVTDLPDTAEWLLSEHGVRELHVKYVVPLGGAAADPTLVPRYEDARPFLWRALDRVRIHGGRAYVSSVPRCLIAAHEECYEFVPAGRTRDEAGTNLLGSHLLARHGAAEPGADGVRHAQMYTHLPPCAACLRRERCNGVIRSYLSIHGAPALEPFAG